MALSTADLIDAHGDSLQSCEVQFRQYGARRAFHGPVRTIRCVDDNALIKRCLAEPGRGAVLVVDGDGSLRTALMGDALGATALAHGWAGIIIHGAVRDTVALARLDLGIKALGSNPRKSRKAATGDIDAVIAFGNATFTPGAWVYSDDDGIVVSATELPRG